MKYLYTPIDLAIYFLISNFPVSQEKRILKSLWEQQNSAILPQHRTSKKLFRNAIYNDLSKYDCTLDELDELNLLMKDMDYCYSDGSVNEQGVIESFFKIIKLQLAYTPDKEYRKIKLRTLLGRFGYKRRSVNLIGYIDEALRSLGIVTYLRGHVPCNLAEIKLDDTVIIRLANN